MRFGSVKGVAVVAVAGVVVAAVMGVPLAGASGVAPKVGSVAPGAGPVAGGTRVTVTGTGFWHVRSVLFGTVAGRSVSVLSSTKLRVTAPKHAAGMVNLRVQTTAGTSRTVSADQFSYLRRPTVTAVSPATGRLGGGTTVTLSGSGFSHVAAVSFGTRPARSWKLVSSTRILAVSPAGAAGSVNVRVRTAGGTSATSTRDRFTYLPPPAVTSVGPTAGALNGGDRVVVVGRNFTGITGVRFGAFAGTKVTVLSSTRLQVTSPAEAAGTVDVRVFGRYGTSTATAVDRYSYVAAPAAPTVASVTAPGPFGPDSISRPLVTDTACTATTCYGVGYYETDVADVPIIETLTDGTWTWAYAPRPVDAAGPSLATLDSIWCGTDSCRAVGAYLTSNGRTLPLIDSFADGTWTASAGPHPSGVTEAYLSNLTCTSATSCVASGQAPGGSILANLDGTTWTAEFLPMPPGTSPGNVSRVGLACGSASYCAFAGIYSDGTVSLGFAETYDGTTWSPALLPAPAGGASYSTLFDVSCPTTTQCVAVGRYKSADNTTFRALIGTDNRGTWTTMTAPLPADAVADTTTGAARLASISCTSGRCTAAGQYLGANGVDGFVDTLQNGIWSTAPVSKSGDSATIRTLSDTACPSPDRCVLVGADAPATAAASGLVAVHGPGGNTQAQAPLPDGVTDTDLSLRQVACNADGLCSAIGTLSTNPSQWLLLTINT